METKTLITRLREESGLNKRQFAKTVGFDRKQVYEWEMGRIDITLRSLTKVLDALGMEMVIKQRNEGVKKE